jgi:hypothetical protein
MNIFNQWHSRIARQYLQDTIKVNRSTTNLISVRWVRDTGLSTTILRGMARKRLAQLGRGI